MATNEEFRIKRDEVVVKRDEQATAKQHEGGKRTAVERLDMLLDHGSFQEINLFVEHRSTTPGMSGKEVIGDGVVTGYGRVDGRLVYVFSQDFAAMGGSLGEMHAQKITNVMDLALKSRAPLIGINDSGGARIPEGIDALKGYGEIFARNVAASGVVPQISIILGPCAGGAVYSPALTDFVFMSRETGAMFITGPQVIKKVTGEDIDQPSLGGGAVHAEKSGVASFLCDNEKHVFESVGRLLSFLPQNNAEMPPVARPKHWAWKRSLVSLVPENPKHPYDIRAIIQAVADRGDLMEVLESFAANVITGFIRIEGLSVGVVANQPDHMAGCLDINSSDKAARFVRMCDAFNIPILTFVDTPGYLPGVAQEHNGVIRHGAKLLYAYSEATVPMVTVIVRKAYGGAYIAMGSKHLGADMVLAWPTAEIAVMGPDGAVEIINRKELKAAEDRDAVMKEKIEEYRELFANPYSAAARGYVDVIILPDETRRVVHQALSNLQGKQQQRLERKHGNIPL